MIKVGSLAIVTESTSNDEAKMKKNYEKFKDDNKKFAKKSNLGKYDLYDSKGWTAKGGAIHGALGGAVGGFAVGGPVGAATGAIGGALGGAGGTKLGRYLQYKRLGKKFDKKGEVDW